jgi:hypothetical protein
LADEFVPGNRNNSEPEQTESTEGRLGPEKFLNEGFSVCSVSSCDMNSKSASLPILFQLYGVNTPLVTHQNDAMLVARTRPGRDNQ